MHWSRILRSALFAAGRRDSRTAFSRRPVSWFCYVNWVVIGSGDITRKRAIPAILDTPRTRFYGVVTRDLVPRRR